jgi:hypothetical protein
MELTILKPDSNDFCEAVGISPERQQVLSKRLDIMVREADSGPWRIEKMHNIWQQIASFCDRPEELIYCTILHCGWQAREGRILAPGPLNREVIRLGIEQLYDRLRKELYYQDKRNVREIMVKLVISEDEEVVKEGAREGVQRLLDLGEGELARDIINNLTGFAF